MTQREVLHFAHANGFPAGTYSKLLNTLRDEYDVISIEKFGHDPRYPVNDNWSNLVKELVNFIEINTSAPIIGVGHSLGGIVTFLAAYEKPELFKQIVLLDPAPVFGLAGWYIGAAKKLHLINRSGGVRLANNRRTHWANVDEAEAYFKDKPLFSNFDPDCLRDYIYYGTTPVENGIVLSFNKDVEAKIFATAPHNIDGLRRYVSVLGKVILGKDTYRSAKPTIKKFIKRHKLLFNQLEYGGHLFPLECPDRTASIVKKSILELNGLNRER